MPGRSRKSGPKMATAATSARGVTAAGWKLGPDGLDSGQAGRQIGAIYTEHHLCLIRLIDHLNYELDVDVALAQGIQHGHSESRRSLTANTLMLASWSFWMMPPIFVF